jgi:putative membrane protein
MTRCLTACFAAAVLVSFAGPALAQGRDRDRRGGDAISPQDLVKEMTPPADSKQFAMKAAQANLFEVKLAELAQQKAQSQEVKQFAQKVQQDHQQANDKLKQIAQSKQIDWPNDLMGPKKVEYEAFRQLDGKVFEDNYVLLMIKGHLHDIMLFQNEAKNGTDQDIKQWAQQTLPHIQQHASQLNQVAQACGLPIDVIARGPGAAGTDTARPAGGKVGDRQEQNK